MVELKTLKDISWPCQKCGHTQPTDSYCVCNDEYNTVYKSPNIHQELKEEALKWIIEFNASFTYSAWNGRKGNEAINEFTHDCYDCFSSTHVTSWIKHFFNINEKELKKHNIII